ncbi:hypothetical protein VA596_09565 [Amycolatopsis sp., V23-08]|uniref:DUF7768 domain-containing protein n=1 Tax=Amycolatopsis heterodermiae TaxID=3110235 RepID=A0ABU5R254_9PSEU|nr:hypothetical protein [Amycolatopsis sp., V23-08]MEA5359784.1 hypothetical protein [Amycolatopsis sp., V23-08]
MIEKKLVYTAQSKHYFYCRDAVCQYVFEQGAVPLNPFRVFDYFLGDRVGRDDVRGGNRRLIEACDEVWIFGDTLADGVLIEIAQATQSNKPVKYFTIDNVAEKIQSTVPTDLDVEPEVLHLTGLDRELLLEKLTTGAHDTIVDAMGRTRELNGSIQKTSAL